MRIASRNSSGRVARLSLDGLTPPEISGQDLRVVVGRTLGWQFIKSTAFELDRKGDRYQFNGYKVVFVPFANGQPSGMAQDVVRRIREVTSKPIKYVVLSHYHAVRVLGEASPRALDAMSALGERMSAPVVGSMSNPSMAATLLFESNPKL